MCRRRGVVTSVVAVAVALFVFILAPYTAAGTSGLAFLKISPGARPTAMGEAFTAVDGDINAMWFNPAGIGKIKSLEVTGTHVAWFQGASYEYLAGVYALGNIGTLGAQLCLFNGGEIKETDAEFNETGKKIAATDLSIGVSYGRELSLSGLNLLVGAGIKFVSESLGDVKSSGISLDFGAIYNVMEQLNVGCSLQNLGLGKIKKDSFPLNLRLGVKYNVTNELSLGGDVVLPNDHKPYICPGVEYVYGGMQNLEIALRAGYKIGSDVTGSMSGLSAGGGVLYKMEKMSLGADIAYVGYGDLGNVIRVSLLLRM
jgi:hypothetical protein